MSTNKLNVAELPTEGHSGIRSLIKLAQHLEYKDPLNNGNDIGDFIYFLEDNPGAIEKIFEWVMDEYPEQISNYNEDEDEDE